VCTPRRQDWMHWPRFSRLWRKLHARSHQHIVLWCSKRDRPSNHRRDANPRLDIKVLPLEMDLRVGLVEHLSRRTRETRRVCKNFTRRPFHQAGWVIKLRESRHPQFRRKLLRAHQSFQPLHEQETQTSGCMCRSFQSAGVRNLLGLLGAFFPFRRRRRRKLIYNRRKGPGFIDRRGWVFMKS
jgi:hypothetical protein